jgi:hypothetical protein
VGLWLPEAFEEEEEDVGDKDVFVRLSENVLRGFRSKFEWR